MTGGNHGDHDKGDISNYNTEKYEITGKPYTEGNTLKKAAKSLEKFFHGYFDPG
jgi:hypothetical protein